MELTGAHAQICKELTAAQRSDLYQLDADDCLLWPADHAGRFTTAAVAPSSFSSSVPFASLIIARMPDPILNLRIKMSFLDHHVLKAGQHEYTFIHSVYHWLFLFMFCLCLCLCFVFVCVLLGLICV